MVRLDTVLQSSFLQNFRRDMIWQEIVAFQKTRGQERLQRAAEFYAANQQMPTPQQH